MPKYDDLHFFIDESGQFQMHRRDLDLVGGVLLFGRYSDQDDADLRTILMRRLLEVGGRFPQSLHFSDSGLSDDAKESFLRAVETDIRQWNDEQHRAIYGVALVHAEDAYGEGSELLAERYYDNRYLSMFWALIEHLCYVDDNAAKRLVAEPRLHLHLAARWYPLDDAPGVRDDLEALGCWYAENKRKSGSLIVGSTTVEEVRGMIRMALRQRWANSPMSVGTIEMHKLDYSNARSPAALYLADLQLGLMRQHELRSRRRFRAGVRAPLLPVFRCLDYGPWLDCLAKAQACLRNNDLPGYLAQATEFMSFGLQSPEMQGVAARQEKVAAELAQKVPTAIERFVEDATETVDQPGRANLGRAQAELAGRLRCMMKRSDVRLQVLELQALLSAANHSGDTTRADSIWQSYLSHEDGLAGLAEEGVRLKVEMRNRRAINLIDQFRHREAITALEGLIHAQEDFRAALARMFPSSSDRIPRRELAACYGTLGQAFALMSGSDNAVSAERCFRQALALFAAPSDIERQWVYLGHLACDRGPAGAALWSEVLRLLPALGGEGAVTREGGQFLLALQIKGKLTFGSASEILHFIERLEAERPLEQQGSIDFTGHPFGLIYQAIGLLYQRAWEERRTAAYATNAGAWLEKAAQHMAGGQLLLRVLARCASIRRQLFALEATPGDPNGEQKLSNQVLGLKGFLAEHFGPSAWTEGDAGNQAGYFGGHDPGARFSWVERARNVLQAIRFNYW